MSLSKKSRELRVARLARSSKRHLTLAITLGFGVAVFSLAGCKSNPASTAATANPADAATDPNADPAAANLAPVDNTTQVAGQEQSAQPTQQSQTYSNPAPIERRPAAQSNPSYSGDNGSNGYSNSPNDYDAESGYQATLTNEQAQEPPPPLPEYAQPPAPEPNYLWTPGYWGYGSGGYYWVPGAWCAPPYTGALWTPGYWGYDGGRYHLHHGFWGPHVGFYGGIDYGFGYVGVGYQGGYWHGDNFSYNRYANNINVSINPGFEHNVYEHNVTSINNTVINNRVVNNTTVNNTTINNRTVNNVSYNGGTGGIQERPRPAELAVLREPRVAPMASQVAVQHQAATNPQQFYAKNQGRPAIVAAPRPLVAEKVAPPPHTTAEIQRAPNGVPVRTAAPALAARPEAVRPETAPGHPAETQPVRPGAQPATRPNEAVRPTQPGVHPAPQAQHATPTPQPQRPVTQTERSAPQPQHTQPQAAHPAPAPQAAHPAPQTARPAPQPQQHTQPAPRPEQQSRPAAPQSHPAPQPRPAAQPHPQPQQHSEPKSNPEEQKKPA